MSFTYDLSTDRGKVRLSLGDTGPANSYVFEDDEIDYFLTTGTTINGATIEGLRVLLSSKAHRVKTASVHGLTINDTAQIKGLLDTIKALGGSPTISITHPTLLPSDYDYVR